MRLRPRPGVLVVVLLAGVLQFGTVATGAGWLSLASGAVGSLLAAAALLAPRLAGLQAVRLVPVRGSAGDEVPTVLQVRNAGRRATAACTALDELPGHAPVRLALPGLLPGEQVEVRVDRRALARTSAGGGVLRLEAGSPFGLLRLRRDVVVEGTSVVHPARVPVPTGLVGTGGGAPGGRQPVPLPGPGGEVLGLRPWRPGEPARAVAPRASARHGRPLVLERERPGGDTLVVLVTAGSGPAWEHAVAQATALTVAAAADREVVLLGLPVGRHPGPAQLRDALAAADTAAPLTPAVLDAALSRAGTGGTLVVVLAGGADRCRAAAAAARVSLRILDGTTR